MKFSLFCNYHMQDRVSKSQQCIWVLGFVQELMRYCFTAFTQLDFTTRVASLSLPPSAAFSRSQLTFQAGGLLLTWESQAENCVGFCSEAAQRYQSVSGHSPWDSLGAHLNASCWFPESLLTSSIFPAARILNVFFQGRLLLPGSILEAILLPASILSVSAPVFPI